VATNCDTAFGAEMFEVLEVEGGESTPTRRKNESETDKAGLVSHRCGQGSEMPVLRNLVRPDRLNQRAEFAVHTSAR